MSDAPRVPGADIAALLLAYAVLALAAAMAGLALYCLLAVVAPAYAASVT